MGTKVGEVFKNLSNGCEYIVKKIVDKMAVLESKDGKSQIFTDIKTLAIETFYQRQEETTS